MFLFENKVYISTVKFLGLINMFFGQILKPASLGHMVWVKNFGRQLG